MDRVRGSRIRPLLHSGVWTVSGGRLGSYQAVSCRGNAAARELRRDFSGLLMDDDYVVYRVVCWVESDAKPMSDEDQVFLVVQRVAARARDPGRMGPGGLARTNGRGRRRC